MKGERRNKAWLVLLEVKIHLDKLTHATLKRGPICTRQCNSVEIATVDALRGQRSRLRDIIMNIRGDAADALGHWLGWQDLRAYSCCMKQRVYGSTFIVSYIP